MNILDAVVLIAAMAAVAYMVGKACDAAAAKEREYQQTMRKLFEPTMTWHHQTRRTETSGGAEYNPNQGPKP